MKRSIMSFLFGIAVAAVVYETTGLRVVGEHERPVMAAAGPGSASAAGSPVRASARPNVMSVPAVPRLASSDPPAHGSGAENDLADAKARAAYAERQLEAVEGRAIPWPSDVAPAFKQELVEKLLKEHVVDRGLGEIMHVDCSEYPCVEVLRVTDASPQGAQTLHAALNGMVKQNYPGRVVLSLLNTRVQNGSNVANYVGVSIAPNDPDTRARARYRTQLGLQEYAQ